ncbi:MAG TPA: nucleoside deaminase, partial [Ktedonobacteraceae bacterium]|nr:nucleoside deaminase [Ktedonobacteraceae bacterium]
MSLFENRYKYPTIDTLQFANTANAYIDKMYAKGKGVGDAFFLAVSVFLSQANIEQQNGGPFGAVIVEFEDGLDAHGKGLGKPRVIGIGTNHVVPNNDPSAHAEMEGLRDAAKRKGFSDLRGSALYTSCE